MSRFVIISGSDEAAVKERARSVIVELCGEDFEHSDALEIIRGDDESAGFNRTLGDFLNAAATPPFFGGEKTVWLRHFAYFADLTAEKAGKEKQALLNLFSALIGAPAPEGIHLVIDGVGLDARTAIAKQFKKNTAIEFEMLALPGKRDRDYLRKQSEELSLLAKKAGKKLSADAAEYLAAASGGDLNARRNDLEKVIAYAGDAPVLTLEHARAVVTATPEAMSWDLGEALTARNAGRALELLSPLLQQARREKGASGNMAELRIFHSILHTYTDAMQAQTAMAELDVPRRFGPNFFSSLDPALKEKFPENFLLKLHPFRAYKVCEAAGRFAPEELAHALDALATANRMLVSGSDARLTLEKLILQLC